MPFNPEDFVVAQPKPLPVCLILDVSSSMSGSKIDSLNLAVEEMISTFAQEEKRETEILVSVISFGAEISLVHPFTPASQITWKNLQANGMTPMGKALEMSKAMIEDKATTPSRAYRPTLILISDGQPTDHWKQPMQNLIGQGRSSKCDRMAMAIGSDADETVLQQFIEGCAHDLFHAENARQLHEFFKMVTMSVTTRTRSNDPNMVSMIVETPHTRTDNVDDGQNDDIEYW